MPAISELEDRTKDELYELAQELDIPGRSKMDKDELVRALGDRTDDAGDDGDDGDLDRPTTSNRSVWKGAITFGLITVPVGLYTATEDRDVSFRLLSGDDGSPVEYKRVSAATGEELDWDEIVKGYEYEDGSYVTFTHEELERIPADSIKAIDIVQFTREEEIDPIYFQRSYYVAPEEPGIKAYRVLREALDRSQRVGLAKVTLREKEHLCALRAKDDVLVLETMLWPDEIRVPSFESLDRSVDVSSQEIDMAVSLIDQLTDAFDPTRFHDSYRERLEEAIEAKIEGEEIHLVSDPEAQAPVVTDLLEALEASVEASRAKRSA